MRQCVISYLLVLRDHASFGNKEFVCIRIFRLEAARNHAAHGTVAHRETQGSYDYKTSHFEKIITHQENTITSYLFFFGDFCSLTTQHEEIEHRKHRQIFVQNPDKIDRKRLSLKPGAWNRLHRFSGRFFNENTPNHKTKSMNTVLDVLMIYHPTSISKDCHQTSQIFA